ncbi:helix-turn-helix domain-containing protein [Nocardia terpenica]|nr:helix-turn-helix transcriptional regulator [Nocardia terpenica]
MGRELRRLRALAGLQQAEAARLAETSPQSIGRMEDGQYTRITSFQVSALCNAYRATKIERKIILALLTEARAAHKGQAEGGWWRAYADDFPADFDHYLALEDAALRTIIWKLAVVPGLLQIPSYRRAVAWSEHPEWSPEQVQKSIEISIRRQGRLDDPNFSMNVLLSEYVLHDLIGGKGVMRDQLYHLADVCERPNVSIRVVPYNASSHPGAVSGSFTLLEFPELQSTKKPEPPVVYVEGYTGALYLEQEAQILKYRRAVDQIGRVALDTDDTKRLILATAEEYEA